MMRSPARLALLLLACLALPTAALAQAPSRYRLPPKDVVDIIDAAPAPQVFFSPTRKQMLLVDYRPWPSISLFARPFLGLGGIRVDPAWSCQRRTGQMTGLSIETIEPRGTVRVELPEGIQIDAPSWSPDGSRFAFTEVGDGGLRLWIGDAATAKAAPLGTLRLNDVLGTPFRWLPDGRSLLVRLVPDNRGPAPADPAVPTGPVVQQSNGRRATMMTYEDLLKDPTDAALFEYYGTSQLARVEAATGKVSPIGSPALINLAGLSPDDKYVLVSRTRRPFSYHLRAASFPRNIEVWDAQSGAVVKTIAGLPSSNAESPGSVAIGARDVQWDPTAPATLTWLDALDGGAATTRAAFRDRIVASSAPFSDAPRTLLKSPQRLASIAFTSRPGTLLLTTSDRDRRRQSLSVADLAHPDAPTKVLADFSTEDAYSNPGAPVFAPTAGPTPEVLLDGDAVYLTGLGGSPEGERPFLDRVNLSTAQKTRIFESPRGVHERFVSFADPSNSGDHAKIITYAQSPTTPPDYYLKRLTPTGTETVAQLTATKDPNPQITGCKRQLLTYRRADGVGLSATLYLPPGYDTASGKRLPVLLWAYPREYADADAAAQVRAAPNKFTALWGTSPLMFLTQGYAVLMDAAMPVLGPAKTMNDTYVEQTVANATAAVSAVVATGYADPRKIVVMGHSYGAFMTANLLAHTDLFAAGIARSGAYNRTLTPFGFQNETRWYWQVPDLYTAMSPFTFANKIKSPLLLIHGQADNNTGTYTIQSERFYDALAGNGATARLVLLPHEAHAYQARESILDVLAEEFAWSDRYAKDRPDAPTSSPTTAATSRPSTSPALQHTGAP